MATQVVHADAQAAAAPPKGRKKLILIIVAALALLLVGGGAAAFIVMKKRAAEAAAAAEETYADGAAETKPKKKKKREHKGGHGSAPVFLPLDLFTVNLADRDAERYAQVGITLELDDSKTSDELKAYMPIVRNDVLMALAHRKATDLQEREGKLALARDVKRAALKALHAAEADPDAVDEEPIDEGEDDAVRAVHFSSFIIQ